MLYPSVYNILNKKYQLTSSRGCTLNPGIPRPKILACNEKKLFLNFTERWYLGRTTASLILGCPYIGSSPFQLGFIVHPVLKQQKNTFKYLLLTFQSLSFDLSSCETSSSQTNLMPFLMAKYLSLVIASANHFISQYIRIMEQLTQDITMVTPKNNLHSLTVSPILLPVLATAVWFDFSVTSSKIESFM